jgi:hypothetical protein
MPPVGFEPAISAVERPQTYALDRARGHWDRLYIVNFIKVFYVTVRYRRWHQFTGNNLSEDYMRRQK